MKKTVKAKSNSNVVRIKKRSNVLTKSKSDHKSNTRFKKIIGKTQKSNKSNPRRNPRLDNNSRLNAKAAPVKNNASKQKPTISSIGKSSTGKIKLGGIAAAGKPAANRKQLSKKTTVQKQMAPAPIDIETQQPMMNHNMELMVGTMHTPKTNSGSKPDALVILAHGFMSSRNHVLIRSTATALARSGIAAYRMDFSGNGDSEGRFEDSTPNKQIQELGIIVKKFKSEYKKVFVFGHDLGGILSIAVGAVGGVDGVIVVGMPANGNCLDSLLTKEQQEQAKSIGFAIIKARKNGIEIPYTLNAAFIEELNSLNVSSLATYLKCPIMIAYGSMDSMTPVSQAEELYEKIGSADKSISIIGGADHNFCNPEHQDAFIAGLLDWIKKRR